MYRMMHKCIMVKIGEAKNVIKQKRTVCGNMVNGENREGKFINFVEIEENMQYASLV